MPLEPTHFIHIVARMAEQGQRGRRNEFEKAGTESWRVPEPAEERAVVNVYRVDVEVKSRL
jgi:hypothetical protein